MRVGVVHAAELQQSSSVFVFCDEIIASDLEGMSPQVQAIAPVASLPVSNNRQRHYATCGYDTFPPYWHAKVICDICESPHDQGDDTDQRNVGVAVGHRLVADLHQSDDGNQRSEKPEPACDRIAART